MFPLVDADRTQEATKTAWHRLRETQLGSPADAHGDLLRQAVSATRALVLAEALIVLMVGFTLDDLDLLRIPGFMAGLGLAILILAVGGLVHGHRLSSRLASKPPDEVADRLEAYRARTRLIALVVGLIFLVWLAFFSLGVPPWAV